MSRLGLIEKQSSFDKMTKEAIQISTDKDQLDIGFIYQYLSTQSYWAKGRSIETVETSIANSMCFGVYSGTRQIGFARVVTDYAVFGWLMDVFIIDEFQKQGMGKKLMDYIMAHPQLANLSRWGLNTLDAHQLYSKYGFKALKNPEIHMEISSFTLPD